MKCLELLHPRTQRKLVIHLPYLKTVRRVMAYYVFIELEAIMEMNSREMKGSGSGGSAEGCCALQ